MKWMEEQLKGEERAIIGIDEVGRGPLSGPVVACAFLLDVKDILTLKQMGVKDSKKLSPKKRQQIFNLIDQGKYHFAVGEATVKEIDERNILNSTMMAMQRAYINLIHSKAYLELKCQSPKVLVDGNQNPFSQKYWTEEDYGDIPLPHVETVIGGDTKSLAIASASVIAKTTRDNLMQDLHSKFPYFAWNKNMGYGTKEHREAIIQHGATCHHRQSFIKNLQKKIS